MMKQYLTDQQPNREVAMIFLRIMEEYQRNGFLSMEWVVLPLASIQVHVEDSFSTEILSEFT